MEGMGQVLSRCYGEGDLMLLRSFLSEATAVSRPQAYWHPGDLVWMIFQNTRFDPRESIRLWTAGEELLGFAVLQEPDSVEIQVRPDLRGRGEIEGEMLRWAAERLDDRRRNPEGVLRTGALESDHLTAALLEELGFGRDPGQDSGYALMHRTLEGLPEESAPEGWSVRPVGGEEEWRRRVDLHREVWAPSKVTLEAYRRLRAAPGYEPGLDLVAVGNDGGFGSYCICWPDPKSKTGLFEPVGTSSSYRRRGLGRAVISEGLNSLRDSGVESALVTSAGDNDAARLLYEAAGFRTVDRECTYSGKLAAFR